MADPCKCGTDALGGCRIHNVHTWPHLAREVRFDERRKVIAELKGDRSFGIVYEVICASGAALEARAVDLGCNVLEAVADSLLAPEGAMSNMRADAAAPQARHIDTGNDKVLSADSGEKNIAHNSFASPSPEPAREGDDVPTYELGAAGARFVTAEDEPWVNAIIEITVPLDGVSVDDERGVKLDAVGELHAELADVLPDSFAQCVSSSHWEDVRPADEEVTPMAESNDHERAVLSNVRRWHAHHGAPVAADFARGLDLRGPSYDQATRALRSLVSKGLLSKPRRGYYLPTEEENA